MASMHASGALPCHARATGGMDAKGGHVRSNGDWLCASCRTRWQHCPKSLQGKQLRGGLVEFCSCHMIASACSA
eukprot:364462-Chlamydomonas_euryale.AAC.4